MRIYVASPFPNKAEVQHWQQKLKDAGHTITHDWTTAEEPARGETAMPLDEQRRHAVADMRGVLTADYVWVIAPATGGTGVWFEMGMAVGLQVAFIACPDAPFPPLVIVSGVSPRSIFTSLVHYEETHEEAFGYLLAEDEKYRGVERPDEPPEGHARANGNVPVGLAMSLAAGVPMPHVARVFFDPNPPGVE
jgi:hypothetical protein